MSSSAIRVLLVVCTLAGCGRDTATWSGEGDLLAVEQPGPWVTIEHDDIPDVLPASTTRILARAPKLTLGRIGPPPGDDKLKLKGRMTIPTVPAFDPSTQGARVLVQDVLGGTVLDVSVPPGPYLVGLGLTTLKCK